MALGRKEVADDTILGFDDGDTDIFGSFMGTMESKPRRKKRKRHSRVSKSRKHKHHTARHRRTKRSSGKIRHTKNGQPYIIQPNGRAKFIKRR